MSDEVTGFEDFCDCMVSHLSDEAEFVGKSANLLTRVVGKAARPTESALSVLENPLARTTRIRTANRHWYAS